MATNRTFADVLDQAQAALNDQAGVFWTDAKLLPHAKAAYNWASNEIARVADSPTEKRVGLTYTANAADLSAIMPADHYQPIKLEWRLNTSEEWRELDRVDHLPSQEATGTVLTELKFWQYRDRIIYVNPSSQGGLVRLTYMGLVADPTSGASAILFDNLVFALGYCVASLAVGARGQLRLADGLMGTRDNRTGAMGFMEQITDIIVKNEQLVPRRGRAFSEARS